MKEFFITLFLLISMENAIDRSKMLIIYFSRTGNTDKFANFIKKNASICKLFGKYYSNTYHKALNLSSFSSPLSSIAVLSCASMRSLSSGRFPRSDR